MIKKRPMNRIREKPNSTLGGVVEDSERYCRGCNKNKSLEEFRNKSKDPKAKCIECHKKKGLANRRKRHNVIKLIYRTQIASCRKRKHRLPKYSLEEFTQWINRQPKFDRIFKAWVSSNYDRWKRPSVDRLANSKTYSLDNIRLVTWRENHDSYLKTPIVETKEILEKEIASTKRKMKRIKVATLINFINT